MIGAYVEPYVTSAVFAHLRDGEVTYRQRSDALGAAQAALEAAEEARDGLHKAMEIADVGPENFAAAMRDAVDEVDRARRELAEAHLAAAPLPGPIAVEDVLDELDVDELRQVLRGALGVVWVSKGRGDLEQRVRMVVRGFEPPGLSVRGVPSGPPVRVELPERDLDGEIRAPTNQNLT